MNYIQNRLLKLRQILKDKDLEAVLISKRENYLYLSGFTGSAAQLIITAKEAILITDFRYVEQASMQAEHYQVIQYQGNLMQTINDILKRLGIQRLGFEEGYVTYSKFKELDEKLEVKELIPLQGVLENLRMTKDVREIENICSAVKIADDAFMHILNFIKPGITELEIAAELEYFMKRAGASGTSFETIVASGTRAAMPHGVASEKIVISGDVITMDYGAVYKDYCSDMTRTVFLGQPDQELKRIYQIVLDAQLFAIEAAKEVMQGSEIDAVARGYIARNGFEKNFGHGLGHGVGLEIHEDPRLSQTGEVRMENGMTVTVEPGIYIEGLGGVRIEDIILIKDDQPTILTRSTKEMIII